MIIIPKTLFSQSLIKDVEGIEKIKIVDVYGDLKINTNSTDKIKIEVTGFKSIPEPVDIYKPAHYKNDNTQLGLHIEDVNNTLIISCSGKQSQFTSYKISIPKNTAVEIRNMFLSGPDDLSSDENADIFKEYMSEITVRGVKNEIVINVFACDIKISNVTGPLVLGAFNGNYDIEFSKLDQDNPSSLELYNGDIKVSLPYDTKSNVTLSAEKGYINTDFTIKKAVINSGDLRVEKKRIHGIILKKYHESRIEGILNREGIQFYISAYNGNIKLYRKDYQTYPLMYPFYLYMD